MPDPLPQIRLVTAKASGALLEVNLVIDAKEMRCKITRQTAASTIAALSRALAGERS